jgi:hypothetical protein
MTDYYQLIFHQIGFLFDISQKNHILRNLGLFVAGAGHNGQDQLKLCLEPAPGQDLSNDTNYEKIGC